MPSCTCLPTSESTLRGGLAPASIHFSKIEISSGVSLSRLPGGMNLRFPSFTTSPRRYFTSRLSPLLPAITAAPVSPPFITVNVEPALALPDAGTETGMLVRLLLAESRSPARWGTSTIDEVKKGMQWMRRVIVNRLNSDKPEEFMAKGAKTIGDIITADDRGSVQFHGFNRYPALEGGITANINDALSVANNGTHPKRALYAQFIQAAIDVATQALPADPSPTGLFGWRTENAGSPGADFKQFGVAGGNTFYTHARLQKKD